MLREGNATPEIAVLPPNRRTATAQHPPGVSCNSTKPRSRTAKPHGASSIITSARFPRSAWSRASASIIIAYRRIDLPNTQILFIAYLLVSASGIALLHLFSRRAGEGKPMPRWHSLLPIATQFALGGLLSAFLVFYSRGSVLTASWPFLLVLAAILIGNEIFKEYYSRLAFTSILFFFALYSYCIVTLPILTGTIDMLDLHRKRDCGACSFFAVRRPLCANRP